MYDVLWIRLCSFLVCWRFSLMLAILSMKKVLHSSASILLLTLGGKGRSRFLSRRLLQMLKFALKSFLLSCSDFFVEILFGFLYDVAQCLMLFVEHLVYIIVVDVCQILSSLLLFLTSAVIVSFICGGFSPSDTFLVFRGVNLSISWFSDQLYNSTKSSGELHSPWYGTSINSLLRWLMLMVFVFLYDTCFIVVTLIGVVFEVWDRWGCDLILVILFLFLWWY